MRNPAFVFKSLSQQDTTRTVIVRGKYVGPVVHEWDNGQVAVLTERGPVLAWREELEPA